MATVEKVLEQRLFIGLQAEAARAGSPVGFKAGQHFLVALVAERKVLQLVPTVPAQWLAAAVALAVVVLTDYFQTIRAFEVFRASSGAVRPFRFVSTVEVSAHVVVLSSADKTSII